MFRPEHKFLWMVVIFLAAATPLWGYYDLDNVPQGPPPNYNQIDSAYFMGGPSFASMSATQVGAYYIFKDAATNRWNIVSLVWPGGSLFEQLHGSVLVQMDRQPEEGVNVWPIGYVKSSDLLKNDRWGWVKWPESIAPNLYEIWWDITIDYPRLMKPRDPFDTIGIAFAGCAFDFNIWATGHFAAFTASQVKLGRDMIPVSSIAGFADTYPGLTDQYQSVSAKSPNTSSYALKELPGASYTVDGLIPLGDEYGATYGGSRAYEGNGLEFSLLACPPPGNNPPTFKPPLGYAKEHEVCPGSTIYDTIWAIDPDAGDIITLRKLSGPGELSSTPGLSPVAGYYSWTPLVAGEYTVIFEAADSDGASYVDSVHYRVTINQPPQLTAADTVVSICWSGDEICLDLTASDPEHDSLSFSLLDGIGTLDPRSGRLCFTPEGSGEYGFKVAVADSCGADTASFVVTVRQNNNPFLNPFDSLVVLCQRDTICFDVTAGDPDLGDSLEITLTAGLGIFTPSGNGKGKLCFLPDNVDTAQYVFHFIVTDGCWRRLWQNKTTPPVPSDSIVITVIINQPPVISCPGDRAEVLCAPKDLCYQIEADDPEGDDLTFGLISGPGAIDPKTGELCFRADRGGDYSFEIMVSDICGRSDTCRFNVAVDLNRPPQVQVPDSALLLCQPSEVCLPNVVTDPDGNIDLVRVSPPAWYDAAAGTVCLPAEATGAYDIIVTAYDACGAAASDTGHVAVTINSVPLVAAPADTALFLCQPTRICLDGVSIIDANGNIVSEEVIPSSATLKDGRLCFMPDTAGTYCFIIRATDGCGATDEDTVCITVNLTEIINIACPEGPQEIKLCHPDTVCLPLPVEPADAAVTVISGAGVYRNGSLCFFPPTSGRYNFTVVATGQCGADTCQVTGNVIINSPPKVSLPDTTVMLCGLEEICLPLTYSDPDGDIVSVTVQSQKSTIIEGEVCFTPTGGGLKKIIVTVADSCGHVAADTANVMVILNQMPMVQVGDTSVFICEPTEICLPVQMSDRDGRIDSVIVSPPAYYDAAHNRVCLPVDKSGRYEVVVKVYDNCGFRAMDAGVATVTMNRPPQVTAPNDTTLFQCQAQEICLSGFAISDPDGNIASTEFTPALGQYEGGRYCFLPDSAGKYCFVVRATDQCGAFDEDTVCATVQIGEEVTIACPAEYQEINLCHADSVCLDLAIEPSDALVRVIAGDAVYRDGKLCFFASGSGNRTFTVVAAGQCSADTCQVKFDITVGAPPQLTCPNPGVVHRCGPDSIAVPIGVIPPSATVTITPTGIYENGLVKFFADHAGDYCFQVVAATECGSDTCNFCVTVTFDAPPVVMITDSSVTLCQPGPICLPVAVTDPDGNMKTVTIVPDSLAIVDGKICFTPAHSGTYDIIVTATDSCDRIGADTARVTVDLNQGPTVAVNDSALFVCGPTEICLPILMSDHDGQIDSVRVSPPAAYDAANGRVCLSVDKDGTYEVVVTVYDDCGASAVDTGMITVTANRPPQVTAPKDTTVFQCQVQEICLDGFAISDPDENISTIEFIPSLGQYNQGRYCFTPDTAGIYCLIMRATDSCGAKDEDTVCVTVDRGREVVLNCPPGRQEVTLCRADSVCLPVGVSPEDAIVTVISGEAVYRNGQLCFYASTSGVFRFTVAAAGACAADTCQIEVGVTVGEPPQVTCPQPSRVFLCGPDTVAVPLSINPSGAHVTLTPPARYENGLVKFFAGQPGQYCFQVIAAQECGSDTCGFCVTVVFNSPPMVSLPDTSVALCGPAEICLPLTFSDPDDNIASIRVEAQKYTIVEGLICLIADSPGLHSVIVTVTDSCGLAAVDTAHVLVTLNQAPTVSIGDTALFICGPTDVCLPVNISDADGLIDSIRVTPPAIYDAERDRVCLPVDKGGRYEVIVSVYDNCGAVALDTGLIEVRRNVGPEVTAPADTSIFQCVMQEICVGGFVIADADGNIAQITITPAIGKFDQGRFCFTPDTAGVYRFSIRVTDSCGLFDDDGFVVTARRNQPPTVQVGDSTILLCGAADVCLPVTVTDSDGHIDSVVVTPPARYDAANHKVCLQVTASGTYAITVTAYDDCGKSASDVGTITAAVNRPPVVTVPGFGVPTYLCELREICLPVTLSDPDGNISSVTVSSGCAGPVRYDSGNHTICWTPSAFGVCQITVIAVDICGAADTAQGLLEVRPSSQPDPRCPHDTTITACAPGEVCFTVGRLGTNVRVKPDYVHYDSATGTICYNIQEPRVDTISVTDSTECGAKTCSFVVTTRVNRPPVIVGQPPAPVKFCEPFTLCFDVSITDPDNNLQTVLVDGPCPGAAYDRATGKVCLSVTSDVQCQARIVAVDSCGISSTWVVPITVTRNQAPQIQLPELSLIVRCDSDSTAVKVAGICVKDAEYDPVQLSLDSGSGELSFDPVTNCGLLSFRPPTNDSARYCFRFRATDNCDTVYANYCLTVLPTPVCSTCVDIAIIGPECVSPGTFATVNLKVETQTEIAGFDVLISYDASVLSFLRADQGPAISGWEYFTYRYGMSGNCQGNCPSGLLRIVSLADINNGASHPPPEQLLPQGIIGSMKFLVSSNQNYGGLHIPISFFWFDCGDNTFSDPSGQYLLVDKAVYSPEGNIFWDEFNEQMFPESGRLHNVGAPDSCMKQGSKELPVRCATFRNGDLCIISPDSIDARGDINLNGIAYEVADAVVYTNYFIYGLRAFSFSVPGQIAASDINGDGLPLSIADLVYLIRIITGEARPYAKPAAGELGLVQTACNRQDGRLRVTIDSPDDLGAVLAVFSYEGPRPDDPTLGGGAAGMDLRYAWGDDNTLRVLIYSFEAGHKIAAGTADLVEMHVSEATQVKLAEMETADYYGRPMETVISHAALPAALELTQNRPNPFNPSTTFELALPAASEYTVSIFNVTGQVIKSWTGTAGPGFITFEWDGTDDTGLRVASGIYLYKAHAAGATAMRKMVLLK